MRTRTDLMLSGRGDWVERDGERFYRIANHHAMPPFFMTVVSAYDHWSFVSSTGGLTCGRRNAGNALFPYETDDKIHDACRTTGPRTVMRVERGGTTAVWRPFEAGPLVDGLERNLYKNVAGNKLVFEEINHDLGLTFEYGWTAGNRFGFIRKSQLRSTGTGDVRVKLLDGVRNLLPYGVTRAAQSELSTLIDAYKQAEAVEGVPAGIYTLSSILTDRAEPSEALKATVVWSTGLDVDRLLLSEDQVEAFAAGDELRSETFSKGTRGAFFVHSTLDLEPDAERSWHLLADVSQGPSQVVELLRSIRQGVGAAEIEEDAARATERLERYVANADGLQTSADELATARHFSNTLFNIMRGGVFPHEYEFPRDDFVEFVAARNRRLCEAVEAALDGLEGPLTLESALKLAEDTRNDGFIRLVFEYLPLTFSRRHGDPSRPWNHFSIELGSFSYQGNWRDIFQNWEALAISFPEYVESFVAKFVNASTPDGHNPYRLSQEGIDWEVLEPAVPWSNIGYWGDHQVAYLLRLLEASRAYHPGRLAGWLERDVFVYADVPYRIKPYRELLRNPRDSVEYDAVRADAVATRVAEIGADGKLVTVANGAIYRVNLLEKLLLSALARLVNLVPGGGIWMNTQRPEWNDANNALVGYGLSMVTLCYLRRYLGVLRDLVREGPAQSYEVSRDLAELFHGVGSALESRPDDAAGRKSFMDAMGSVADRYRASVYQGFSGEKQPLTRQDLDGLTTRAIVFLDRDIALARRDDGLFHSYNLVHFGKDGYDVEPLDEMLEGQVAVLSSGALDGETAATLLEALRESRLYRTDRKSYMLYPDRKLPSFLEKNVIPSSLVESSAWIRRELDSGRTDYVERDVEGGVHFNGVFRNANALRETLADDPAVTTEDAEALCEVYEAVFEHRRFTGRSGSMYKYEGLGCIYWHMVSKLALAAAESIETAVDTGADRSLVDRLVARFREIREGLGVHMNPAEYGAFPIDPYSHTPGFTGAQQPGMTGQAKEDVITRFRELGVRVVDGEVAFRPAMLDRREFLDGSLSFTLCGVPVVYRLAKAARLEVFDQKRTATVIPGTRLGPELSRSLFRREQHIAKIVVEVPE